jgi:hypothetical protein
MMEHRIWDYSEEASGTSSKLKALNSLTKLIEMTLPKKNTIHRYPSLSPFQQQWLQQQQRF